MKRITKLIYLALGSCLIAGLNASCELVSENYGDINTSIFPKTAEDADAITTSAAYATFKNSGYGGLFNIATGIQIVSDEAGDYGMCNWGWDHINYANWNTLKISGSGSWLTVESYAYVNDISKMTLTIDRLNDIEMDDALKQQYIAELRMGRGWLAYLLYDFYGPIPIADLETLKNPMAEKILPRLSEEEMQTYIETELTEASKVLPANYKKGDKNYGRFTAGLAHTVLLKLYMLTKQWDKAEAEGRELMKPEYGFELVPEYKDIFTLANEKNPEIIWACQCAKGYQEHKWQPHVMEQTIEKLSIKRYRTNTIYWNVRNNADQSLISRVANTLYTNDMMRLVDKRGDETITYPVVRVTFSDGTSQVWTAQNLNTTKYPDGTEIEAEYYRYAPESLGEDWIKAIGTYYSFVIRDRIIPKGWRIPTEAEWNYLFSEAGKNGGYNVLKDPVYYYKDPTGQEHLNEWGLSFTSAGTWNLDRNAIELAQEKFYFMAADLGDPATWNDPWRALIHDNSETLWVSWAKGTVMRYIYAE